MATSNMCMYGNVSIHAAYFDRPISRFSDAVRRPVEIRSYPQAKKKLKSTFAGIFDMFGHVDFTSYNPATLLTGHAHSAASMPPIEQK